jgi:hypothetical protein
MSISEARLAANRSNALRSSGPRTPEGKAISRRNSLKHGMAGEGIVTPLDDSAEVERRAGAMLGEMAPRSEMGRYLVKRLAELTVRVERCSRHERAATEALALQADAAFDEARIAAVDHAMSWIRAEPATHVRKLRSMPEGVDRMIAELLDLRKELDDYGAVRWDWTHGDKFVNLTGGRWMDVPVSRIRALSEAVQGKFEFLLPGDGDGLEALPRREWARDRLVERIDGEVESLLAHREMLDVRAIEEDRAGAPSRALFDPSKAAILARRYEAAAERAVYRALRELKEVEASAPSAPEPEVAASLGSSGEEGPEDIPRSGKAVAPPGRVAIPAPRRPHSPPVGRPKNGQEWIGRADRGSA